MIHTMTTVKLAEDVRVECSVVDSHGKNVAEEAAARVAIELHGLIKDMYGIDARTAHLKLNLALGIDGSVVEGRWVPHTAAAVIVGGPQDGLLLHHPGAPHTTMETKELRSLPAATFRDEGETASPTEVDIDVVDYECIGWSDTQHAWAYSRA